MPADIRLTYPTALVLLAVREGIRHGFDIIDATGLRSGTVYPILRRLEDADILRSDWEGAATARDAGRPPRRYYEITSAGAAMARGAIARYPLLARDAARAAGPIASPA